jgi:hypothetical protein
MSDASDYRAGSIPDDLRKKLQSDIDRADRAAKKMADGSKSCLAA